MRLYLSSYKFGNKPEKLFELLHGKKSKVAVITNATDMHPEVGVVERLAEDIAFFSQNGLEAERLNLCNYFGKQQKLNKKMEEYDLVWVKGGNTFLLRVAMRLSGFDEYIKAALKNDKIVYAGFSAGGCVLSPSLKGFDTVDDPSLVEKVYGEPADYSGLGILSYHFEPHYKSDHPESDDVDKEVEYLKKNKIPYKTLHDGEAIVIDGRKEELVG
ncbi:Type 1 glutamine amidotransferase-like domain-containing protein [soil metagenome]